MKKIFEPIKEITNQERKLGMTGFVCPKHGRIVVTYSNASVRCGCGKQAQPTLSDKISDKFFGLNKR